MKRYLAYIRVSTAKQGTHGVSLAEQKAAIERYALRSCLNVSEWFEERETAAKRGRPVFSRMLSRLRRGDAHGVIIHKIDRSARNLKDWADLGELIDAGVDVHFAADALDLASRGGRLSADIQAVVAADYIRNLREETRKGFYGRLKQGLYPLAAPIGYLDQGGGKPKTPDPKSAPIVRTAFALYATGDYTLRSLQAALKLRELRNVRGGQLSLNGLSKLLTNPFYCGLIRLRSTGETYKGVHEPLIPVAQFERVQQILKGKSGPKVLRHNYLFRRFIQCAICERLLIGERQKGHVYYRCHTPCCATKTLREDAAEASLRALYARVQLTEEELSEARHCLNKHARQSTLREADAKAGIALQLADARSRLDRLTDALVDGLLVRTAFEERRSRLMLEIARLEERMAEQTPKLADQLSETLELAATLISSHDLAETAEKRRLLEITISNFSVTGKKLDITPREPFLTLANRHLVTWGDLERHTDRTTEVCQRRTRIGTFVDAMLVHQAKKGAPRTDAMPANEEGGGKYDPSVYELIKRKRSHYKNAGSHKEFDTALRKQITRYDQRSA